MSIVSFSQEFRTSEQQRQEALAQPLRDGDRLLAPGKFLEVPDHEKAAELAEYTRSHFVRHAGALAVAECVVEAERFGLTYKKIPIDVHALFIPMLGGSAKIWVDTELVEGQQVPLDLVYAARIGHELGHTFFYGSNPARPTLKPLAAHSKEQERFCDAFAGYLLFGNVPEAETMTASLLP